MAEATPALAEARNCMTRAGAPAGVPEAYGATMDKIVEDDQIAPILPAERPPGFDAYYAWIGDQAQAEAFVWTTDAVARFRRAVPGCGRGPALPGSSMEAPWWVGRGFPTVKT